MSDANEIPTDRPVCSVMMDDDVRVADDFVAILADETGAASIYYYTDAVTLGMAIQMISQEYMRLFMDLPEEDQDRVVKFLGPEFDARRIPAVCEEAPCETSKSPS